MHVPEKVIGSINPPPKLKTGVNNKQYKRNNKNNSTFFHFLSHAGT